MKLYAFILVFMIAAANILPTTTLALSHTTTLCSSNHGNDVPPVHTHSDCPHTTHGFQINFVNQDSEIDITTEAEEILHTEFYLILNTASYLGRLFKPPRI